MARTEIPILELTSGAIVLLGTTAVLDAENGNVINAGGRTDKLILLVARGDTDSTVTVKAGINPPAFTAGLGDLVHTFGLSNEDPLADLVAIGPFETARFIQPDGSILIDTDSSAGYIWAIRLS